MGGLVIGEKMLSDDAPMNQAVWHWRMINDLEFRDRWQKFGAYCEESATRQARELLIACESLDAIKIHDFVKEHTPSSDVIAKLVILAKNAQKSKTAKNAAKNRHTGNHASKLMVFAWCDTNMGRFQSMDDAAIDIAESFVPQKFRAVRDWITEWKKLRSTGTP